MSSASLNQVLLIDDSASFRGLMSKIIAKKWPDAKIVELDPVGQQESASSTDLSHFDLICLDLDLGLPDEDGLSWLRNFTNHPNAPAIIMISGEEDEKTEIQAIKLGVSAYLTKNNSNIKKYHDVINDALLFRQEIKDVPKIIATELDATTEDKTLLLSEDQVIQMFSTTETSGDSGTTEVPIEPSELLDYLGYSNIKHLAKGGVAEVLMASDDDNEDDVIIKVIRTSDEEDEINVLKRFVQEYTLISNMNHPNIIQIYERSFSKGYAYIVMEYFPGGDLTKKIKTGITQADAINYLRQIAEGLKAIHKIGIIHRDMKSANILFRDDNTLVITDFGIAKSLSSNANLTAHGEILGTPHYMSPEQIDGTYGTVDCRSDLYSLGVILFEMLTGEKAYQEKTLLALLEAHTNKTVPSLPENVSRYQPLIAKLMAKNSDERYQNADELLTDIDKIANDQAT